MSAGARGPLGNLIADAQRWAGSADLAVMNAGGVRAALDTGVATYGSLFEIQPFGNRLVKLRVRGRDLRAYLERIVARREPNAHLSGVTVVYDSTRAPGNRIVSLTLAGGRPLADDSVYSIVMNDFMVAGGDGLGLGAAALSSEELNIVDLDALISYLEAQPKPVRAPRDQRLVLRRP
jgi:2',3'-cyclic-nucleotide 2'-phosphodiesterase (5'-nucleotidase family)